MAMQSHALVELSQEELDAYEEGKKAAAERRRKEKELVKSTHSSAIQKSASVKAIQSILSSGDDDGDGTLDFSELTGINADLYETLGLKDATALLQKYDYNNDGQLDVKERREIILTLIPQLDKEAKMLNRTGEYTSASFLWQNLKSLKETLRADHKSEIIDMQNKESTWFKTTASREGDFLKERAGALSAALEADFDLKEAFLKRVFEKKMELLHAQKHKVRDPTGPITTKMNSEILNIRHKLEKLSHTKKPTDIMLMEGTRLQKVLHKLEDQQHAKHAMLAPAYFKRQEKELKERYESDCAKMKALRIKARTKLRNFVEDSTEQLGYRHKNYSDTLSHSHTIGVQDWVLDDVRPVRSLPALPALTSKTPTGNGTFGRLSNGLSATKLYSDIIPPPGQILRVTTTREDPMAKM